MNSEERPLSKSDNKITRRTALKTGIAGATFLAAPAFFIRNAWAEKIIGNFPGRTSGKAVKFGFNVPQTGPYSDESADELRAYKLAVEHINDQVLHGVFAFLPDGIQNAVVAVTSLFVGDGWHMTLGALFMLIVIFLPGGIMEGVERLFSGFRPGGSKKNRPPAQTQPAE